MRSVGITSALAAALLSPLQATVSAQTDITLELGASQVGPPLGVDAQSARFGVAGLRASHYSLTGSGISASVLLGRTIGDPTGGDFLSGTVGGTVLGNLGGGFWGGLDARFLGFGVRAPFPYRAFAAEGGPTLQFRSGRVSLRTGLVTGFGRSRVELWRVLDGESRVFIDDLWRVGGTADLLLGSGPLRVGFGGGLHDTPGGGYQSGGGRIVVSGGWGVAEIRADIWSTPLGSQTTGGLVFAIPVGGWSFRGFVGRSQPDPLTLAEPGSGSGGFLVGRSLLAGPAGPGRNVPHEILAETGEGARVRLTIQAPDGVEKVELLGDFTLWEAVPMARDGDRWSVVVEVGHGTHHYGFLVDEEWYVPEETTDVVPDEWGRESAILVIEGVG